MYIALIGLPGAGKTTLARSIAASMRASLALEPEEPTWPDFVREGTDDFARLMWFRAIRTSAVARAASESVGGAVVADSYYDKLCAAWLGAPGMEWLIDPSDPYFEVAKGVAELDRDMLPAADIVVVLSVSEKTWLERLTQRGRRIDLDGAFRQSHSTQRYFADAARRSASTVINATEDTSTDDVVSEIRSFESG